MRKSDTRSSTLYRLLSGVADDARADALLSILALDPALLSDAGDMVSRPVAAMALGALLFEDLLARVPTGAAYVADVRAAGGRVMLDHGALRTIRFAEGPTGAQPAGREGFDRILIPLGYEVEGVYPLDRLRMTGFAFTQQDLPDALPQYFVSELHTDRFSDGFQAAARRVFGGAADNLPDPARAMLDALGVDRECRLETAIAGLPGLAAAFGRWHPVPDEADYEALLAESKEAAWIATEGWTFNHATDRVADVEDLAIRQRELGRPIKAAVEVSATGRVRQTAFRADPVEREFRRGAHTVTRAVPGSFYEFITRDPLPDPAPGRRLDLGFDSANATGIFKMTESASS